MDNINPLHSDDGYFYFNAQTGVWKIRRSAVPKVGHVYALLFCHLATVQLAVRAALPWLSGLSYPNEFMDWLDANDKGDGNA